VTVPAFIDSIAKVQVDSLKFDDQNARKHPERNLEAIKASLSRFGQQKPIVALKDGTVIAGNGTFAAAKALGWTEILVAYTALEEKEARAFAIADNRSGELATWDDDILRSQLDRMSQDDPSLLEAAGYAEAELRAMLERAPMSIAEIGRTIGGVSELPSGFTRTLEEYDASQVRTLIFAYTQSQYGLIVEALASIAEEQSLETNADVLVYLIEKAGHAVTERIEADD
jgi:hypothetical protein